MDKIIIRDLVARGVIGVYEWERTISQEMVINLTLFTDTRQAGLTDDLNNSIDYSQIAQNVLAYAEKAARKTVEALAEDIAAICLKEPGIIQVQVRVEKPGAVRFAHSVGVEIERGKDA